MLKIRLSMGGAKKRPIYKIVIADSRFPRDGRFIEKLGFYNPLLPKDKKERIGIEEKRVKHWLSKGAQPTIRVARILGELGMMPMPAKVTTLKKLFQKKIEKKKLKQKHLKLKRKHLRQKLKKKHLKQKLKRKHLRQKLKRST